MAGKPAWRVVVDADVAAHASDVDRTRNVRSQRARDFLLAFQKSRLRVVMSPQLRTEWSDHASPFSSRWLTAMQRKLRVEELIDDTADSDFEQGMVAAARSEGQADDIRKDLHLLVAAIATDRRVSSCENRLNCNRDLFRRAAESVSRIRTVCWVNPEIPEEDAVQWIERGAPNERRRQLGHSEA